MYNGDDQHLLLQLKVLKKHLCVHHTHTHYKEVINRQRGFLSVQDYVMIVHTLERLNPSALKYILVSDLR